MSTLIKFPSIEQFRNVRRNVEWRSQYQGEDGNGEPIMNRNAKLPTLTFIGTEKLHGSCCSFYFSRDEVICQSRERIITCEDDNYGFAKFVHKNLVALRAFFPEDTVIYGEWAGKGIQNKVAICELEKFFAVFAAKKINGDWVDTSPWNTPEYIRVFNIYKNKTWEIEIDFENPADAINQINTWTLEVEEESPFAKQFNVSGIGEGIVFLPADLDLVRDKFCFKSKGDKHSGSKVKTLATIDTVKMKSVEEFVEKTTTEERLMQGWNYLHENKLFDHEKSTGAFLSWIFNDILKEESDTLEASGLNRKDVSGVVAKKARTWYLTKINK